MPDPDAPTRPHRRWFRFSLRSLLVFMVLVGLLLGWIVKERRQSARELEIALELEKLGWHVSAGGPFDSVDAEAYWKRIEQEWWQRLAENVLGRRIYGLYGSLMPSGDLAPLAALSNLRFILFIKMRVGDLAPLANVQTLERLTFAMADVNDLTALAGSRSLQRLDLNSTGVRDLTPLMGLNNLKSLRVRFTPVTQEQVDALEKALPNCKIEYTPARSYY